MSATFTTSWITSSSARKPKETQYSKLLLFTGCSKITLRTTFYKTNKVMLFFLHIVKKYKIQLFQNMLFLEEVKCFDVANSIGRIHTHTKT